MANERISFAVLLRTGAGPFAFAAAATVLCLLALNASLPFYFAGMVVVATLLPSIVAMFDDFREAFVAAVATMSGIVSVWLPSAINAHIPISQSLAACIVLAAVGMALLNITRTAKPCIGESPAAAITTILFIAWLAWPVWLSSWLGGSTGARIAAILAPAHPLLTLNRIFLDAGLWTQQSLMYQLTTLGQDVPYALPATILPCVLVHGFIALALWPLARRSVGPSSASSQLSLPAAAA